MCAGWKNFNSLISQPGRRNGMKTPWSRVSLLVGSVWGEASSSPLLLKMPQVQRLTFTTPTDRTLFFQLATKTWQQSRLFLNAIVVLTAGALACVVRRQETVITVKSLTSLDLMKAPPRLLLQRKTGDSSRQKSWKVTGPSSAGVLPKESLGLDQSFQNNLMKTDFSCRAFWISMPLVTLWTQISLKYAAEAVIRVQILPISSKSLIKYWPPG